MPHTHLTHAAESRRTAQGACFGAGMRLAVLLAACVWLWPATAAADEWNQTFAQPRAFVMNASMPLHEGPSNGSGRLGPVDKGSIVFVSNIAKGWCRLQTKDGRSGYIFKRYLVSLEAPPDKPEKIAPPPVAKTEPRPEPKQESKAEPVAPPKETRVEMKRPSPPPLPDREPTRPEPARPNIPAALAAKPDPESAPTTQVANPPAQAQAPTSAPTAPTAEEIFKNGSRQGLKTEPVAPPRYSKADNDDGGPQRVVASRESRLDSTAPGRETLEEPLGRASGSRKNLDAAGCSKYLPLRFGQGGAAATAENNLNPGGQDCYRFLALKDHKLDIVLTSTSSAVFDLYTPLSGQIISDQAQCLFQTRSSGDKVIVVKAGKDNATYKLNLTIR